MDSLIRYSNRASTMGCVVAFLACGALQPARAEPADLSHSSRSAELLSSLVGQGIEAGRITGVDSRGIPIACGTVGTKEPLPKDVPGRRTPLPVGLRGWESIPCVIRRNGVDTFRLEVNVNSDVAGVTLDVDPALLAETGGSQQSLRDD